jgi:hypothetical protein
VIRLALTLIKYSIFAVVVLILGQWLQWGGMSLSDQVRVHMAHPKNALRQLPQMPKLPALHGALDPKQELRETESAKREPLLDASPQAIRRDPKTKSRVAEQHPSSERQELEAILSN